MNKDDIVSVELRVGDWIEIIEQLYLDADAESDGPAGTQLHFLNIENDIMRNRAIEKDSQAYCHRNRHATDRCAEVIDKALKEAGWIDGQAGATEPNRADR